jgi:ubiquinone biosynthesis protein Coq4
MDLVVFDRSELIAVARALRDVAQSNDVFSPAESDLIVAVGALHDVVIDPSTLTPITPDELASAVKGAHQRKRALQLLVVMALAEGEPKAHAETALERFAAALDVDLRDVQILREVAKEHVMMVRFDMVRRLSGTLLRDHKLATFKSMATAAILGEDRALADKYRALAQYPEGTLGRALFDYWKVNGFGVPGEKGSMPERGIFHDVGHLLSGYGVDPRGEIRQGAFQAGFVRTDGFAFLLFAILQFHLGVRITPIAKSERGYFDPKDVLRAAHRGASCRVDLSDPQQWDFWAVADQPIADLRARYGILPL